ncbi:MAG TPA: PAS domain S-box protein [Longimicrobiales bacterium]|nr:PAS domain S-box protein [Longimicrobiales bacterium]
MPARKILIAAADGEAAERLGARLASLGHEVAATARSVDEAVRLSVEVGPDLALMGIGLGAGTNEPEAVRRLQRVLPVPTVLVIPEGDEASLRRAGLSDADAHVVEPFTDRELRANIELALCRSDATREAHDLEDRFFAASIDMLCCLDFNGYFKRLSPSWERALGFTREELMSRPFIEFVHPDDRERTLRQNREVRAGGQALGFENRYLCKDGSFRWFLWNATPEPAGQVIYSVARDVTARKQMEEERERLVRDLQAALSEVKDLEEILPICSYCGKIRDDEDYWLTVESYFARHTSTRFSHGVCPSCHESKVEPELERWERG